MSDSTRFFSFFALYLSHFTCLTINLNLQYSLLRLLLQFTNITIYLASNRVIIFKLLRAIIRASSFVKSNYTKLSLRFGPKSIENRVRTLSKANRRNKNCKPNNRETNKRWIKIAKIWNTIPSRQLIPPAFNNTETERRHGEPLSGVPFIIHAPTLI